VTLFEFAIYSPLQDLQGRLFGKRRTALPHDIVKNCRSVIRIVASFVFWSVIMISKGEIMITPSHKQYSPLIRTRFFHLVLETLRIGFPMWPVVLPRDPRVTMYNTCNLIFTCERFIAEFRVDTARQI